MALNIDGTTGISGVDRSASIPTLQGTDSNTGINFGSDTVNINTGGVTRATVDSNSSGNRYKILDLLVMEGAITRQILAHLQIVLVVDR